MKTNDRPEKRTGKTGKRTENEATEVVENIRVHKKRTGTNRKTNRSLAAILPQSLSSPFAAKEIPPKDAFFTLPGMINQWMLNNDKLPESSEGVVKSGYFSAALPIDPFAGSNQTWRGACFRSLRGTEE